MLRIPLTTCLILVGALGASIARGQTPPTPGSCQKAMAKESANYIRSTVQTVDRCLSKMSVEVMQKGATVTAAAASAAKSCAAAFSRLADTGASKELGTTFDVKVGRKCDALTWDGSLGTGSLGEYCATFGGDGSVDSFAEWKTCLRAGADAEARDAIATRWPRALEYFAALAAATPPSSARSALVALDAAIEGPIEDDKPDPPVAHTGLLNAGATQCTGIPTDATLRHCPVGPQDQDSLVQAGFDARYTDVSDGTITDQVTGSPGRSSATTARSIRQARSMRTRMRSI